MGNIKSGSIGVIRSRVWGLTPNPSQERTVGSGGVGEWGSEGVGEWGSGGD
ncbi:MAG: hypothetical protein F6K24_41315 [Okeania sp. SIO2D1]|nr:hypothetical protein [Okeania sp. SIO2D1]